MKYKILDGTTVYSGRELRSGWVREQTGIDGDAAAAFIGPCHVSNEDLVDMDDARAGAHIESASMAHVIVEHPGCALQAAVLRQRLLVCLLCEILDERGCPVRRDGDDVYCSARKLTVSIAAPAPASAVIHLGINIRPDGAPVPAIGLDEMGVGAVELLGELLERYRGELDACSHAERKVRTVP